jgi:hypothetical protein
VGIPLVQRARYALGRAEALLSASALYEDLAPEEARRQQLWQAFLLGEDAKEAERRRAMGPKQFRRITVRAAVVRTDARRVSRKDLLRQPL